MGLNMIYLSITGFQTCITGVQWVSWLLYGFILIYFHPPRTCFIPSISYENDCTFTALLKLKGLNSIRPDCFVLFLFCLLFFVFFLIGWNLQQPKKNPGLRENNHASDPNSYRRQFSCVFYLTYWCTLTVF